MITAAALGPLPATPTVPLDAGGDDRSCREVLAERGMEGQIATRGLPAPIQAGRRWPVERTHAWGNQYGKLGWCTERRRVVVEFWLLLALALIVVGRLIRRAWTDYRWEAARAAAHDRLLAQALSRVLWGSGVGVGPAEDVGVAGRSCPSPVNPGSPGWAPAPRWECRRLNLGHFAAGRWQLTSPDQPTDRPEVLISGEGFQRGPVDVLGTLLHEAAHGLAYARQVQDTSR